MRRLVLGLATAAALAAVPAAAAGEGFTLGIDVPPRVEVGTPVLLRATGTIPVRDLPYSYWLRVVALSPSVVPECPADHGEATQIATGTGGTLIVFAQRVITDAAGAFSMPFGITPTAAGRLLLCGYLDDGATNTLAGGSTLLDIQARASSPAPPSAAQPGPAEEARRGIRSCRALLDDPRSCIAGAVRRAKARCRRKPSRRGRTACLREVARVARRT